MNAPKWKVQKILSMVERYGLDYDEVKKELQLKAEQEQKKTVPNKKLDTNKH